MKSMRRILRNRGWWYCGGVEKSLSLLELLSPQEVQLLMSFLDPGSKEQPPDI